MKWRLSALVFLTGLSSLTRCLPHQYHFVGTALPWLDAQTYCRERYTDLATVLDTEDMNRLVNTAQDSTGGFAGKAWIGLHDNLTSWRWSFSDSRYYRGEERDYRSWDVGQPDNFLGDQMCVKMWNEGVWDDSWCFLRNPFICYDGAANASQRFVFVEQKLSWFDAQLHCRERYTDLASVRNETENQEIQLLARYRSVWIGLNRTRRWSDRSDSTYRHWKEGQPDNVGGEQNCTATDLGDAGLWSDEQCSRELAFICYGESDEPSSTVTPHQITTTESKPTAAHLSTGVTLNTQSSTEEVHHTRTFTSETPDKPFMSSTTVVTPIKGTTTKTESNTFSPETTSFTQHSTREVDRTRHSTNETPSQPDVSTTDGDSGASSHQYSTPTVEQTRKHVIILGVKLSSRIQLSEDDIKQQVLLQFRNLLIDVGLSASIKVAVKRPLK